MAEDKIRNLVNGRHVQGKLIGDPITDFRSKFRRNAKKTGKFIEQEMVEIILSRLNSGGVEGETYSPSYRKRKMRETSWTPSQGVDLEYSGTLKANLTARSQFQRNKDRIIVDLIMASESRPTSITNTKLARILNGEIKTKASKVGSKGPPLSLHKRERDSIMDRVANKLTDSN